MSEADDIIESPKPLLTELRGMIGEAREQVANAALATLYWRIGKRIHHEVLEEKRADYGKQIVASLGRQLAEEFGAGFGEKNLRRMVQFAEVFPDQEIVVSLVRQLSWTHFLALIPLKEPLQREFYAEMCRVERWSVRTLRDKIGSMLYERTAISKQPEDLARAELAALPDEDQLKPDLVFRDPYILDFLGLKDRYLENKHEQQAGEESPLDIILCAGKKEEQIELLELDHSGIHVAEYLTALPPRELLQQKLHAAIEISRAKLEAKEGGSE